MQWWTEFTEQSGELGTTFQTTIIGFAAVLDNQMAILGFEIGRAGAVAAYNKARAEIDLLTGRSPE